MPKTSKSKGTYYGKLVTKKEFRAGISSHEKRMDRMDKRFDSIEEKLAILMSLYVSMDAKITNIEEHMYTKEDHSKFMALIDAAMWEMKASQEGRVLNEKHVLLMDDQLDNYEKRITVLEQT